MLWQNYLGKRPRHSIFLWITFIICMLRTFPGKYQSIPLKYVSYYHPITTQLQRNMMHQVAESEEKGDWAQRRKQRIHWLKTQNNSLLEKRCQNSTLVISIHLQQIVYWITMPERDFISFSKPLLILCTHRQTQTHVYPLVFTGKQYTCNNCLLCSLLVLMNTSMLSVFPT